MSSANKGTQEVRNKGLRRRRRIYLAFICGFSIWAGFSLIEQTRAMTEQKEEMEQLQMRLEEVRAAQEAYKLEVTRLQDPEYIEQKVRKDYGYVRPGDFVIDAPLE